MACEVDTLSYATQDDGAAYYASKPLTESSTIEDVRDRL